MKGGYKRGDHVFNHGLTKLGLRPPTTLLLKQALHQFQRDVKSIEEEGGLKLVATQVTRSTDENADLFGRRLETLRLAWDQLNRVSESRFDNPQHRAQAVFWVVEALTELRLASFDAQAEAALLQESNPRAIKELKKKISETHRDLDQAFDNFLKEIQRLMPSPSAITYGMIR